MTPLARCGFALALLLMFGNASVQGADAAGPRIYGLVRSTDSGKGGLVVAVQHDDDAPIEHAIIVTRDVPIQLMKKPQAKLSDLRSGMRVVVVMTADERFVRAIQEWRALGDVPPEQQPGAEGTVRKVDAEGRRLTLLVRDGAGAYPITFGVSSSATVMLAGNRPAKLDQLKPGMRVVVTVRDNDCKVRAISQVADGK